MFSQILVVVQLLALSLAFKITDGTLSVGSYSEKFTCCDPISAPVVIDNASDDITLEFSIKESENQEPYRPNQVSVSLQQKDYNLQQSFLPKVNSEGKASLTISVEKLSKNLLFYKNPESTFELSIILGDFEIDTPVIKSIANFQLSTATTEQLIKDFDEPKRYSIKPEIKHIFKTADKQANPIVASVFIGAIVLSFFWFFGTIFAHGNVNLKNFASQGSEPKIYTIYKIAFIGSIVAFEGIFIQYYLGDSIFSLITKVFFLTGPSVWFGSRVFRSLLNRKISKSA